MYECGIILKGICYICQMLLGYVLSGSRKCEVILSLLNSYRKWSLDVRVKRSS